MFVCLPLSLVRVALFGARWIDLVSAVAGLVVLPLSLVVLGVTASLVPIFFRVFHTVTRGTERDNGSCSCGPAESALSVQPPGSTSISETALEGEHFFTGIGLTLCWLIVERHDGDI